MKQPEIETLARAAVIERAVLMDTPDGWECWFYDGDMNSVGRSNVAETARGGRRTWASLDTAYRWIRSLPGPAIRVSLD